MKSSKSDARKYVGTLPLFDFFENGSKLFPIIVIQILKTLKYYSKYKGNTFEVLKFQK